MRSRVLKRPDLSCILAGLTYVSSEASLCAGASTASVCVLCSAGSYSNFTGACILTLSALCTIPPISQTNLLLLPCPQEPRQPLSVRCVLRGPTLFPPVRACRCCRIDACILPTHSRLSRPQGPHLARRVPLGPTPSQPVRARTMCLRSVGKTRDSDGPSSREHPVYVLCAVRPSGCSRILPACRHIEVSRLQLSYP